MKNNTNIVSVFNEGSSPIVLTGPHNGWHVPDEFIEDGAPLGLPTFWFDPKNKDHRHEACDWGMQELFNEISNLRPDICLVSAEISRLVVDLNRVSTLMVYETSSETFEPLKGNTALSTQDISARKKNYYDPYHHKVDQALQSTKANFTKPLWIDMHSFTPVWQGKARDVGVGTLKLAPSQLTHKAESWLSQAFGKLFVADHPYDMSTKPFCDMAAGRETAARNDMEYLGLEIRNDLISTPDQITDMANKMIGLIDHLSHD